MAANSAVSSSKPSIRVASHDVFRYLIDSVTDYAIFVLDPHGRVAHWNAGAERLQGYTPDEIIGKHFGRFYTQPDQEAGRPEYELRITREQGRFENEGWRVRKDGSRFWANVLFTRLADDNGNLIGFGTITRDLTERRHSDLRYKLLVEGVIDYAIFSMDPTGVIGSWNQGAERLKGYTADEIIGRNFSLFYSEHDRRVGLPQHVLRTAAETGHFEGEGWRYRKDGSRFWASVVVTALRDEEGQLYGYSKVTRDMTERKQLLDELQRHSNELELRVREREETNAELEAFAYSVSHDLRAPLRAISGFATALSEDYEGRLDETAREYLNEITGAAARMQALVQDLLDYGRVSRIELTQEAVNLRQIVDHAVKQLGKPEGRKVDIRVAADVTVRAFPPMLEQVIFNLLSNAIKFSASSPGPDVRVWAEQLDGRVRLSVRDNGIGIAVEHQERIWNVFERLHDRETYPGTGIGLAIVKRAVIRMQGSYGVQSEPGKGSTFWIELARPEKETN